MAFLEEKTARLLSNMPWYWVVVHWIVTIVILVVLVPVVLLILINPFWFREWAIDKMDSLFAGAFRLRRALLGPVYDKYSLFDTIKDA